MFAFTRGANRLVRECRTREKLFYLRSWRYVWPETRKCLSTSGTKLSDSKDNPGDSPYRSHDDNPVRRTFNILSDDLKGYFGVNGKSQISDPEESKNTEEKKPQGPNGAEKIWPSFCDVLVIGGGAVGSSVAYHIKERALKGLNVVVVEEDSTYKRASTVLSVGGIRQQFSVPENIQLSLYGMDFLRRSPELLAVEGMDPPDVQFNPSGYLTLASEAGVEQLRENFQVQIEMGAKVDFMSAQQLKRRFPWLNTDGVEAGVIGLENEGWFDPWNFLFSLRRKAVSLGTEYVNGKVTGLEYHSLDDMITEVTGESVLKNLNSAEITLPDGGKRNIRFSICVVAAGAWSGEVGRLVGIGNGAGIIGVPIPVEPRKRYVYCVHAPDGPGLDSPLLIDPNGTYFRREGLGGLYLCGQSPTEEHEPSIDNLDVDHEFFESNVWPTIANRVPSFENLKLQSSWAGYYDYNTFDQNGIIGLHPIFTNMFIATGFSGHGIQQAAGVGRAVMESILHGEYQSINLERFGFERVLTNEPLYEQNIV